MPGQHIGSSEKVLRENDERVLVEMIFYDFRLDLDEDATEVQLSLDDDLSEAKWFSREELKQINLGGATQKRLQKTRPSLILTTKNPISQPFSSSPTSWNSFWLNQARTCSSK